MLPRLNAHRWLGVAVATALASLTPAQNVPYGHALMRNLTTGNLHSSSYASLVDIADVPRVALPRPLPAS